MSAKLWSTASVNAFSTTLNGSITDSDNTITLTTVVGLVYPGILVIDRQDANGEDTPASREYISYTGISSNTLTGVSRGLAGSTGQSHSSGAIIEEVFSVTHWNELIDFLNVSHDSAGNIVANSMATLSSARISEHLNVSGASITGVFPIHPTWYSGEDLSSAASLIGGPIALPQAGEMKFISAALKTAVSSGATLTIDVNKNGTTIFTDQNTRLILTGGMAYASTASFAVTSFAQADLLSVDLDKGASGAAGITVSARIE